MRVPEEIAEEHARCPTHLQGRIVGCAAPARAAEHSPWQSQVRVEVSRSFRGTIAPGTQLSVRLDVFVEDDGRFDGCQSFAWAQLQGAAFIELCVDEHGHLPSTDSAELLDALTDAPQLELPPRCQSCSSHGFLVQVPEARPGAQRLRVPLTFFLFTGGLIVACLAFIAQAIWAQEAILYLVGLGLLTSLVGGLALLLEARSPRASPPRPRRCLDCGARG